MAADRRTTAFYRESGFVMKRMSIVVACMLLAGGAGVAEAQTGTYFGHVTGQVGVTAGSDLPSPAITPSVTVSVQDNSGWGAELDFGYAHSPGGVAPDVDLGTFMVNVNWMAPRGLVRPYGVAGVGVVQVHGCLTACAAIATTYDFGLNVGGGAMYPMNDAVSVRGDLRYFRASGGEAATTRPGAYGFWRASVGVTFTWAIVP